MPRQPTLLLCLALAGVGCVAVGCYKYGTCMQRSASVFLGAKDSIRLNLYA